MKRIQKEYDHDDLVEIEAKTLTQRLEEQKSAGGESTTTTPSPSFLGSILPILLGIALAVALVLLLA